jgi:hypothetical protein
LDRTLRQNLKLPITDRRTMHLMAKAAVAVHEGAVKNHCPEE